MMLSMLNEVPGIKTNTPQGAFYIFPDVSHYFGMSNENITIKDSNDFCMFLLNDAHVALLLELLSEHLIACVFPMQHLKKI